MGKPVAAYAIVNSGIKNLEGMEKYIEGSTRPSNRLPDNHAIFLIRTPNKIDKLIPVGGM